MVKTKHNKAKKKKIKLGWNTASDKQAQEGKGHYASESYRIPSSGHKGTGQNRNAGERNLTDRTSTNLKNSLKEY